MSYLLSLVLLNSPVHQKYIQSVLIPYFVLCFGVKIYLHLLYAPQLLTNIFFIPYLALRLSVPEPEPSRPAPPPPPYSPALGYLGAVVGAVSISWAFLGRPEFGGLPERLQYFQESFQENRVFFAFCLDAALYSVWQAILMPQAEAKYRFVPFAGLAAWLISGCPKKAQ